MSRILITFSGDRYHLPTKKIVENGHLFSADQVWVYDDVWLETCRPEFIKQHQALFDKKCHKSKTNRGFGFFVWKPYIIQDALRRAPENSVVCFVDGDCWPVADMSPLYDMCERDSIVLFAACGHSQRHWSKADTQQIMGMNHDFWRDQQAGVARFMLFKKGASVKWIRYPLKIGMPINATPEQIASIPRQSLSAEDFLSEWLKYTADIRANTFELSVLVPEFTDLKEPRCEQAILTNLAHKYNIPLHRENRPASIRMHQASASQAVRFGIWRTDASDH